MVTKIHCSWCITILGYTAQSKKIEKFINIKIQKILEKEFNNSCLSIRTSRLQIVFHRSTYVSEYLFDWVDKKDEKETFDKKETRTQLFSSEICFIFNNTCLYRTPPVAAHELPKDFVNISCENACLAY